LDALVRICGDSPFLDPALVDQAIALFAQGGADLVSNVVRRTYPKGQSVEVMSREALARAERAMASPEDREHVTRFLYAHPEDFCIRSMESGGDFGAENFCVDTADDLQSMALLARTVDFNAARPGWRELLARKAGA
jgi:spore coat polysaccharide biosynthesis protein SpsF